MLSIDVAHIQNFIGNLAICEFCRTCAAQIMEKCETITFEFIFIKSQKKKTKQTNKHNSQSKLENASSVFTLIIMNNTVFPVQVKACQKTRQKTKNKK